MVPVAIIILIVGAALTVWIVTDRKAREKRVKALEDAMTEVRRALRRGGLLDDRGTL